MDFPFVRLFIFMLLLSILLGFFAPPLFSAICLTIAIICLLGAIARGLFFSYGDKGFTPGKMMGFALISGGTFRLLSWLINIPDFGSVFHIAGTVCFAVTGLSLLLWVFKGFFT